MEFRGGFAAAKTSSPSHLVFVAHQVEMNLDSSELIENGEETNAVQVVLHGGVVMTLGGEKKKAVVR